MDEERPLESWKEISGYLRCSLRTCQRWEQELGLPIHRLDGTPKARVFAYRNELDRWLREKLNHREQVAEHRALTRSRLRRWLAVSAACCLILAAGALGIRRYLTLPPLELPESKPLLAVLPFENASGEEALDPWATALPDLIITDLTQSRIINIVRITELARALVGLGLGETDRFSEEDLRRVFERTGANRVALGSIMKAGADLLLTVSVKDPRTGEEAGAIRVDLDGERGVFAAADELARGIKRTLAQDRKHLARDVDKAVRRVSTASPQAFLLYSQGLRQAGLGMYQEGVSLLLQAVDIDPKFALSYKYLWRSSINMRREDAQEMYIRKAVELSGRLSERERGDLTVLFYRHHEKEPVKEREALERLWRFHPDDRFGGIQLMGHFREQEEWRKALAVAEIGHATNPQEFIFVSGLVHCYENTGRDSEAMELLNGFLEANPDHPYWYDALLLRADAHRIHGRYDEALADIATLMARYPNRGDYLAGLKAAILIYRGDYDAADQMIRERLEQGDIPAQLSAIFLLQHLRLVQGRVDEAKRQVRTGLDISSRAEVDSRSLLIFRTNLHYDMAYLHRVSGELREALEEIEMALGDQPRHFGEPPSLEILHLKALILLDMNRMEEFESQLREIKGRIEEQKRPKMMRVYHHLAGCRELRRGDPKKAIDLLGRAADLLSIPGIQHGRFEGADPQYVFSLAEAYERLTPVHPSTLDMYERTVLPSMDRLHSGDLHARSLLRLAKIHDAWSRLSGTKAEDVGSNKARAIEYYRKFLELWKEADPMFAAEVDDARQRLKALSLFVTMGRGAAP